MSERIVTRLVEEGDYVAKVEVTLIDTDSEWSPYYSLADVQKLEAVEAALRAGDLNAASKLAPVYRLTPVAAE